ncbi:MAG: TIGR02757 family protein [Flavobacteriales bacterium]|jgi:uncharacterized protein (TIGR02757 family)|nr:TIGR02757 family protein [Flavobacteriales bacterium]
MSLDFDELKTFLDNKVEQYNNLSFIENDPISIPHLFSDPKDIEISGFITATIAWGKREMIIRNGKRIVEAMDFQPYNFVLNYNETTDFKYLEAIKHRTFNSADLNYFIKALQYCYQKHGGLEHLFSNAISPNSTSIKEAIINFRSSFFEIAQENNQRTFKHVSNPAKGSAAKRINMFLRWMVRNDNKGVDFGIWKSISPSILSCPLDVHSGNVARSLNILSRQQNDWKALEELDQNLRQLDQYDPVKYDFALFGLGINENFK